MAILQPFLAISVPPIWKHFTKLRFRQSFWGTEQVWIMIDTIVMTQNAKQNKKSNNTNDFFSTISQKTRNGNICILSHNLWINQGLDLLSTSKWLSEPQSCKIWSYSCQKMARNGLRMAIYNSLSFPNSLYILHAEPRLRISFEMLGKAN